MPSPTKTFFNLKIILGAVIFGIGIFALLVWFLWLAKANTAAPLSGTAIVKVIEAPTQTPLGRVPTPTPTSLPSSSQEAPTPMGDINIKVGNYVQVNGTGGDGLRLHSSASVSSKVNYVAIEAEVSVVKDGPTDADGYVWWKLEDPYTDNAVGWGVANYLRVVHNP